MGKINYKMAWSKLKIAIIQKPRWKVMELVDLMTYCEIESLEELISSGEQLTDADKICCLQGEKNEFRVLY